MSKKHIMIDIETMGVRPTSSIISIGAVAFDSAQVYEDEAFEVNVDLESCLAKGMTIDASTIYWWLGQAEPARVVFAQNKIGIRAALEQYVVWHESHRPISGVWGNGSDFDLTILGNAFDVCRIKKPYTYGMHRCFRTMKNMNAKIDVPDVGIAHKSLDDAIWQARYMVALNGG